MRLLGPLGLTSISALLFGASFPPTGWTALAWVALAPFLVAIRSVGWRAALLLTWVWCLLAAWAVGDWFPRSVASYFLQPLPVAVALFFAVFTVMAGPYYAAFALAYRGLARRGRFAVPLLAGAAWAAAELGRGRLFTGTPFFIGNPWGLIGYSQVEHLRLIQFASITGVYGIGFAIACANAALAELWMAWRFGQATRRRAAALAGIGAVPALVLLAYGSWVLRAPPDRTAPGTPVAVVQGNLDVGARWSSELYGRNLDVYLSLTDRLGREESPRIVFWPEAAMTFFLEEEPAYRRAIASILGRHDLELVAGGPRRITGARPGYFNSIHAIAPDGAIRGRYDKQHLVPFAEYFPLRIDVMRREFGRIRVFEHGHDTGPLPTRAGPAGVLVCNEVMLPEVVGERVRAGAVYLLNPSNDSWIADPKYTGQQLDIARLRAVEQRRYLVRASTAGPSAIVDPFGRVTTRTPALARDVVNGEIHPRTDLTVYGRVGDLFAFACAAIVAGALVRPSSRGARAKGR